MGINGGTVSTLDTAYVAHVRDAGDMVVYDNIPAGSATSQVFIRPTTIAGSPVQLTTDTANNYESPQWSKDGTKVILLSDKDNPQFDAYLTNATVGAALTRVTNLANVDKTQGVTLNPDGTVAAFVGVGTVDIGSSGIYRSSSIGVGSITQTQIVTDALVESGIYWTGSNGRSRGQVSAFFGRRQHHGLVP